MNFSLNLFGRNIIDLSLSKRGSSSPTSLYSNPKQWLMDLLGGAEIAGVKVNANTALTFSAYYGAVKILAETMGILTVDCKEKKPNGNFSVRKDMGRDLLSIKPNSYMTPQLWHETMMAYACNNGNAYALIYRDSKFNPSELVIPENQGDVYPYLYKEKLYYYVAGVDSAVLPENIFHIRGLSFDGYRGMSLIQAARLYIAGGIASQNYSNDIFNNGTNRRAALVTPAKLEPKAKEIMRKEWRDMYGSNAKNRDEIAILHDGVKLETIGISPEDAQLIESKEMSVEDFSRFTRVPLHMLQHFKNSTGYNSLEQLGKEFALYTMTPWITRFQQEANAKLLRYDKIGNNSYEYNLKKLIQSDTDVMANLASKTFPTGAINANDIREMVFGLNPREDEKGKEFYTAVNVHSNSHEELKKEEIKTKIQQNGNN